MSIPFNRCTIIGSYEPSLILDLLNKDSSIGETIIPLINGKNHNLSINFRRRIFLKQTRCQFCQSSVTEFVLFSFRVKDGTERRHFLGISDNNNILTIDHVIAKSKGGKDTDDNYQLACSKCNQMKRNKENFVPIKQIINST